MRRRITIDSNGRVVIFPNIMMADFEVAELFEISLRELRAATKTILKSQICFVDNSKGSVERGVIYPSRYNLDIVVSLSFYLKSSKAQMFREEIIRRSITRKRDIFIVNKLNERIS